MPDITESTLIPAPLGAVWPLLSDPGAVASCIPGATLAPDTGDGVWRGAIKVKFGPTIAVFKGEATLLAVKGSFTVTGPLETFANAGGVHVARALLAEFAANMAALVAERTPAEAPVAAPAPAAATAGAPAEAAPPPPPPAPPAPPRVAAELSASGLLWRAFLSWLRGLFGKGNA